MNKLELKILVKEIAKSLEKSKESVEYLKLFSDALNKKPSILNLLSNPLIPFEMREEAIKKALEFSKVPEITETILLSLFKGYGLNLLPQIASEVENEFLKMSGILPVDIFIPLNLEEDLKIKIINYLEKKFGKKIKANFIVKEEILGGFEAISESYHLIASIKGSLKTFKLKEEKWQ